jgi:hypothetical protein
VLPLQLVVLFVFIPFLVAEESGREAKSAFFFLAANDNQIEASYSLLLFSLS